MMEDTLTAERSLVWYFLCAREDTYLVQRADVGRETAVHAEGCAVYYLVLFVSLFLLMGEDKKEGGKGGRTAARLR